MLSVCSYIHNWLRAPPPPQPIVAKSFEREICFLIPNKILIIILSPLWLSSLFSLCILWFLGLMHLLYAQNTNEDWKVMISNGMLVTIVLNNCYQRAIILYLYETWSLILRGEHRPKTLEERVLMRIFGPERNEIIWRWINCLLRSFINFLFAKYN